MLFCMSLMVFRIRALSMFVVADEKFDDLASESAFNETYVCDK